MGQPNLERKAFVLLSGGLDSTTCLYQAIRDYAPVGRPRNSVQDHLEYNRECSRSSDQSPINWVEAFSIDYGQRHRKEGAYAESTCGLLGIRHRWLHLGTLLGRAMLTDPHIEIPSVSYSEIKGVSPTYVPNRNMTMLSVLVAQAQIWVNEQLKAGAATPTDRQAGVYFGAHADDALNWAYPDCTPEFIGAMANAIYIATYHHVRLHTPLMWMTKSQIVTLGHELGVPFHDTWSCYKGEELHCGICPTCRSRREAFQLAGIEDPTKYASPSSNGQGPDQILLPGLVEG